MSMLKLIVPISIIAYCIGAIFFASQSVGTQHHPGVPRHDTIYTFQKDILPLLQANCNPCHFPGGKMYEKLPFDDSATVAVLGKKLSKRFKMKEEQNIIDGWKGQSLKETENMSK